MQIPETRIQRDEVCLCWSAEVFSCVFVQGCLPLVLMFDIKEDVEVEPQCITALMEQLDVFISIKPKPKQPSKVPQTRTCTAQSARLTR